MSLGKFVLPWLVLMGGVACSAADKPADAAVAAPPAVSAHSGSEPAEASPAGRPGATASLAGWYMQHGSMEMFQACGAETQLQVDSAELRAQAKAFGLEPDSPVYVRLVGVSDGSSLSVASVEQFGAPEPVRDCAMTGVVLPANSD